MTTKLPAPKPIIELSSCGCKYGCNSGRCCFHRNSFMCFKMCLCKNCENAIEECGFPDNEKEDRTDQNKDIEKQ